MTLQIFENGLSEYVEELKNTEFSDNTIKKYSCAIKNFIEFAKTNGHCDVICKNCFKDYKEYLKRRYATNTSNLYIVAVNRYLRYMNESELCIKTIKIQSHNSLENCLTTEEYYSMLAVAKEGKNNTVYYIMRAIACTGIRFKGLEYFTVDTINKGSFVATNKGKTRVIVIPPKICKELIKYCEEKGIASGYVFHARNKNKPLSEVTVWRWLKETAKKAGIDTNKAFPHNLRHLFARTFMETHNNLGELADILGYYFQ